MFLGWASWRDADGGAISSLKISPMALVGDARVGPPIGKKREQRLLSGIHSPCPTVAI